MNQGDVYLFTFKPPDKRRPVLILTRDALIPKLNAVSVAPMTTTFRNAETEVVLTEDDGMSEDCVINLTGIQTVAKDKIGSFVTHLSIERMREVKQAIEAAFGFDKL